MLIATSLLLVASALPAVTLLPATSKQLAFEHEGRIVHSARWRDKLGDHTLLLDETGEYPTAHPSGDGDGTSDASVYAYEYLEAGGKVSRVWKLEDHVRDCAFDLVANFVPDAVTLTAPPAFLKHALAQWEKHVDIDEAQ